MDKILMDWSLKVVGTYGENKIEVTEDDINSIVCGALEGGIGYWACLDVKTEHWKDRTQEWFLSDWATKIILENKPIVLIDEEENQKYELTLEKLLKGLSLNAERRKWDSNIDNFDAISYDCIVQYAIFDDVVYG